MAVSENIRIFVFNMVMIPETNFKDFIKHLQFIGVPVSFSQLNFFAYRMHPYKGDFKKNLIFLTHKVLCCT